VITSRWLLAAICSVSTSTALGQSGVPTLPAGTTVPVATTVDLSSRTSAKGDIVALVTTSDVELNGRVVIPKGMPVVGQIAEARSTGGMGVSGRLIVRALHLQLGSKTIRLSGQALGDRQLGADTVVGMLLVTSVISGKSAKLPAGSVVPAFVERTVTLDR
jgi:hypothetical protein